MFSWNQLVSQGSHCIHIKFEHIYIIIYIYAYIYIYVYIYIIYTYIYICLISNTPISEQTHGSLFLSIMSTAVSHCCTGSGSCCRLKQEMPTEGITTTAGPKAGKAQTTRNCHDCFPLVVKNPKKLLELGEAPFISGCLGFRVTHGYPRAKSGNSKPVGKGYRGNVKSLSTPKIGW